MTSNSLVEVKHFGSAGHFVGSDSCRFHLCAGVGQYLISTVGEYYPSGRLDQMVTLGASDDSFGNNILDSAMGGAV